MIAWLAASVSAAELDVVVRDRDDGDPIAGAIVVAGDARATSGDDGHATLSVDGSGPWTLEITAEGRAPQAISVPEAGSVRVWLSAGGGPLEVVVEGLRPVASTTRYVVDGEQAAETPGTLDDAVRLVQALPGVTVQREYAPGSGELSVRGADPSDTRYFLDGIELPYLYHYNQYASVFPASQVGTLELYPSTFSAANGDAVGAVIDARTQLAPPAAVHGGASLNFVMGGADVAAPIGRRGWWLSASGRRSYLDLAGSANGQYTVWPRFGDWLVRAEQGDADNGVGVFTFGAFDGYTRAVGELDVLDPLEAEATPYLAYQRGFQGLGTRAQWRTSRRAGRASVGLVHDGARADLTSLGGERRESVTLSSRIDNTWSPPGALGGEAGAEVLASRTGLTADDVGDAGLRVAEEAPALARGVPVDDEILRLQGGVYGIAHLTTGPVRWMPGARLSADSARAELQVEPRATVRWTLGEQTMLKLGGGRYTQRPESELLLPGTGDPALPTTRSWQLAGGLEQTFAGRLEVGVDAYQKWLSEPLLTPIDGLPFATPSGRATGAELVVRYRLRELFFLWGWVSVARATATLSDGTVLPMDGDQRASGGFVASLDAGPWNLGARYRYASGLPFTQLEGSIYDAGSDAWTPLPGPTNGERLPPYHKVDARVGYTWSLRGWSLEAVAEVWVVPARSAQLYPTWNYDYREQGWVLGPTVLPLLGARARF